MNWHDAHFLAQLVQLLWALIGLMYGSYIFLWPTPIGEWVDNNDRRRERLMGLVVVLLSYLLMNSLR